MQTPQPTSTYEGLLSLLGRVQELWVALLLLNAALYVDLVVRATSGVSLPSTPTPLGNATPVLTSLIALAGFGVLYVLIALASSVVRQLIAALLPGVMLKASDNWSELPPEERRDFVWPFELDRYLDVHYDEALKRAYDKYEQLMKNVRLIRKNSAVTFALLLLLLWQFPHSLVYALFAVTSWGPLIAVVALLWFAYLAFGSSPTTFYKVELPGRGVEIREQVQGPERQLQRPRPWMDDAARNESLNEYPLRGEPVKFGEPFRGVAEDDWTASK